MRNIVIALGAVLASSAAAAEHPCKADVEKFCAGVQPGHCGKSGVPALGSCDATASCAASAYVSWVMGGAKVSFCP